MQFVLETGIASCSLADLVLLLLSDTIGTTERIRVQLTSGWFLVVGLLLLHPARQPHRSLGRAAAPVRPGLR